MPKTLLEGEDFYWEGPYMVLTEKFLRERGYCCESGCRHCPYGFGRGVQSDVPRELDEDEVEGTQGAEQEDT